jgi:hypothetical protein
MVQAFFGLLYRSIFQTVSEELAFAVALELKISPDPFFSNHTKSDYDIFILVKNGKNTRTMEKELY